MNEQQQAQAYEQQQAQAYEMELDAMKDRVADLAVRVDRLVIESECVDEPSSASHILEQLAECALYGLAFVGLVAILQARSW